MHPNALLDLTTELLRSVMKLDAPADGLVSMFFRKHRDLGARERHTLAETTYAVLRQRLLYQHLAQNVKGADGPPERRLAILAWQGNEGFLRGALNPQEQAWLAEVAQVDRAALPEKLRHNLPDWLANPLREQLGDEFWPLVEELAKTAPLDLRVNAMKHKREEPWMPDHGVVIADDAYICITGPETFVPKASPMQRVGPDDVMKAARTARDCGARRLVLVSPLPAVKTSWVITFRNRVGAPGT